jgi:hypothetical protein
MNEQKLVIANEVKQSREVKKMDCYACGSL